MKTLALSLAVAAALILPAVAETKESDLEKAFRDALYIEEVKGDAEAALKAYEEAASKIDLQRDLAATALFRKGECLRKLNRPAEAAESYRKLLQLYPDRERVAKLAKENLAAIGQPVAEAKPGPASPGEAPAPPALSEAAEVARLEKMLKDSPDLINSQDENNPLQAAVSKGQLEVVDFLLKKGANPNLVVNKSTGLHLAAGKGYLAICQKLLDKGADVNLRLPSNDTALLQALNASRFAVAELLLQKGAKADLGTLWRQRNPQKSHHFNSLELALQQDAPLKLIAAILKNGSALKPKDGVSANDEDFPVAMRMALEKRNTEVVKLMLEHGAGVNEPIWKGGPEPLSLALGMAKTTSPEATDDPVVEFLLKEGADWKAGSDAIKSAARQGLTGYIRQGVAAGAKPDAVKEAVYFGQEKAVKTLIELGAKVDAAELKSDSNDPSPPLYVAISSGDDELVSLLLSATESFPEEAMGLFRAGIDSTFVNRRDLEKNASILRSLFNEAEKAGWREKAATAALEYVFSVRNRGYDQKQWVKALELVMEQQPKVTVVDGVNETISTALAYRNPELLPVFDAFWSMTRIKQNKNRSKALWSSRGPSLARAAKAAGPYNPDGTSRDPRNFNALFFFATWGENTSALPGTLGRLASETWRVRSDWEKIETTQMGRDGKADEKAAVSSAVIARVGDKLGVDWEKIEITRMGRDGKADEKVVVNFAEIARAGDAAKDFTLQWGDVVEFPPREAAEPTEKDKANDAAVAAFLGKHFGEIEISFSIGDSQRISNANNGKEAVLRIKAGATVREAVRTAGVAQLFLLEKRMARLVRLTDDGSEGKAPHEIQSYATSNESLRHGDRLTLIPEPQREPRLSDEALLRSATVCESVEGPFLRLFRNKEDLFFQDGSALKICHLMMGLHGPNSLGLGPVDWSRAMLRQRKKGGEGTGVEWITEPLGPQNWDLPVTAGTTLVLPPLRPDAEIKPDDFPREKFARDWQLAIDDEPPIKKRFAPSTPLLRREKDQWVWEWKEVNGKAPTPIPLLETLLTEELGTEAWPSKYVWELVLKKTGGEKYQTSAHWWLGPETVEVHLATAKQQPVTPQPAANMAVQQLIPAPPAMIPAPPAMIPAPPAMIPAPPANATPGTFLRPGSTPPAPTQSNPRRRVILPQAQ